jgi:transposase
LIHGARAVLPRIMAQETPLGRWARSLSARAHKNVVVVALAAKLARIVWAVLRIERGFDPAIAAALECGHRPLCRWSRQSAGGERKMA